MGKSHTIISTEEKIYFKNQNIHNKKHIDKLRWKGNFNIMSSTDKTTYNWHKNKWWKTECFPPKMKKKAKMPTSKNFWNTLLAVLKSEAKKNKIIYIYIYTVKEAVKLYIKHQSMWKRNGKKSTSIKPFNTIVIEETSSI